jgi:hypothetical protein
MAEQALSIQGSSDSQISKQSAHECSEVIKPTHRPILPHEIFLALISVRR